MRYLPLALVVFSLSFLLGRYRHQLFSKMPNSAEDVVAQIGHQPQATTAAGSPKHSTFALPSSKARSQGPTPHVQSAPARDFVIALESSTGAPLYSYLFDGKFGQKPFTFQDLEKIKLRFRQPYPAPGISKYISAADREAVARIGLLKAFGESGQRHPNPAARENLRFFYQTVLAQPQETLMVKRQALRSLASLSTAQTEKEKMATLAQVDPHVISAASMTDQEIAEASLGK